VVAPDDVNTTFFGVDDDSDGKPNFLGTSAAAPQVAALTALLRQAHPTYTPSQLFSALDSTATAIGTVPNYNAGYGEVNGLDAEYTLFTPLIPDLLTDNGQYTTDNLTTVTTPTFTGNVDAAAAGAIVTLWIDGVQKKSQTLATGTTAYSLQSTVLGAGNHTAVIRAQMYSASPASSFYPSPGLAFTIDDGTPPVATITQVTGTQANPRYAVPGSITMAPRLSAPMRRTCSGTKSMLPA